jgi:CO/xanthine dehydrogenase FAD-binding subunit
VIVISPTDLGEALRALADATPQTRLLAGGTDLMVELENGRTRPDRVVNLWPLRELRGIVLDAGTLRIGALSTCTELTRSLLVAQHADILAAAAREIGAVQIRNRATLGGNLGTASPAADLNPVLFALGARVRLTSLRGPRELPVEEFIQGYRATARALDEVIECVLVPARAHGERRSFRKVGTRKAQSISKVVAALCVVLRDGRVHALTAAAGSVADRTQLLPTLAEELVGRAPTRGAIDAAARRTADRDVTPQDDVRSSAEYRREVLYRILRRMLVDALEPERA